MKVNRPTDLNDGSKDQQEKKLQLPFTLSNVYSDGNRNSSSRGQQRVVKAKPSQTTALLCLQAM